MAEPRRESNQDEALPFKGILPPGPSPLAPSTLAYLGLDLGSKVSTSTLTKQDKESLTHLFYCAFDGKVFIGHQCVLVAECEWLDLQR